MTDSLTNFIHTFIAEVWTGRGIERIERFIRDDLVMHRLSGPDIQGLDEYRDQILAPLLRTFPDLRLEIQDILQREDQIAVRWLGSGTHEGTVLGIPPTGEFLTVQGMSWYRIQDGKIAEIWDGWDRTAFYRQVNIPE